MPVSVVVLQDCVCALMATQAMHVKEVSRENASTYIFLLLKTLFSYLYVCVPSSIVEWHLPFSMSLAISTHAPLFLVDDR